MAQRILIVDDQPDIRRLVRMTLELTDCELHEAVDGAGAWVAVRELQPDLVLLDVMMPGTLDGYEVCARIKQDPVLARTRVVLLTARGQAGDIEAGRAVGADGYLIKPFSPLELIEQVEAFLDGV
jgi:CheY-like chemotaxis protein